MIIEKKEGNGESEIVVLGETLCSDSEGNYLLPGRLIVGLKTDDLPSGIRFTLLDQLPSGIRFFREDTVIFSRLPDRNELSVEVTSVYDSRQWDGLFPLQATMDSRRCVIDNSTEYELRYCGDDCECWRISYCFARPVQNDLETALEEICDKVRWVEEKGNEQLLFGRWQI
ncbi:hypothetical protein [Brevibacillus sp. H7]|jgi:hypothetical protein|uniref:hypothetical protein n=1 Tax=Brevibacillus sp. H7 TaxID=3349138 RepID=UPI0037FE6DCD